MWRSVIPDDQKEEDKDEKKDEKTDEEAEKTAVCETAADSVVVTSGHRGSAASQL